MGPADAAEKVQELVGGGAEAVPTNAERARQDRFRNLVALYIAVLALTLAITSLGGANVVEDMIDANIRSSDTWNFFQAKNIRQTNYELAADALEAQLEFAGPTAAAATRNSVTERVAAYRANAERYDSEPDPKDPENPLKGEGKKQLLAQARDWEKKRDLAQLRDPNFDYAEALLQIAIVLASVAIVAMSRPVIVLSGLMGGVGTLLMLNGYLVWFRLPF